MDGQFDIRKPAPNRLDIVFSGKLDRDGMKAALDDLVETSQDIENGRMLYTISDFEWPTLGAIGVELARLPALFRMIRRFDKAAVIADKKWLRKAGEIEGALIPGLQIKAFEPGEEADAEAWLAAN